MKNPIIRIIFGHKIIGMLPIGILPPIGQLLNMSNDNNLPEQYEVKAHNYFFLDGELNIIEIIVFRAKV